MYWIFLLMSLGERKIFLKPMLQTVAAWAVNPEAKTAAIKIEKR
jgi:hypothetical protein